MSILKRKPGELDKLVRDVLWEMQDSGTGDLIATAAASGYRSPGGGVRRALKELRDQGIISEDTSGWHWRPGSPRPADYTARTVKGQQPMATAPQAPQPPTQQMQDDAAKKAALQARIQARMDEIKGRRGSTESDNPEDYQPPKPKKITTKTKVSSGKHYVSRELAGQTDIEALRKLREKEIFALLSGPPGTGKTVLVEAAFGTGQGGLFTVTADENTSVNDFMGQWSPTGDRDCPYVWVDGPLVTAMREGGTLFIDDATLANPKVLAVVYPAMDGRREVVVKEHIVNGKPDLVKAAPGFYVVAAHNPGVHGAILTDALASRFIAQVWVESDLELAASLGVNERPVRLVQMLQTLRDEGNTGLWIPQLRELLAFRDMAQLFGEDIAAANLLGQCPEDSQEEMADRMRIVFGKDIARLELGKQL